MPLVVKLKSVYLIQYTPVAKMLQQPCLYRANGTMSCSSSTLSESFDNEREVIPKNGHCLSYGRDKTQQNGLLDPNVHRGALQFVNLPSDLWQIHAISGCNQSTQNVLTFNGLRMPNAFVAEIGHFPELDAYNTSVQALGSTRFELHVGLGRPDGRPIHVFITVVFRRPMRFRLQTLIDAIDNKAVLNETNNGFIVQFIAFKSIGHAPESTFGEVVREPNDNFGGFTHKVVQALRTKILGEVFK